MHSLVQRLEFDLAMSTSSLNVVRLDRQTRVSVGEALVPPKDLKVRSRVIRSRRFITWNV